MVNLSKSKNANIGYTPKSFSIGKKRGIAFILFGVESSSLKVPEKTRLATYLKQDVSG